MRRPRRLVPGIEAIGAPSSHSSRCFRIAYRRGNDNNLYYFSEHRTPQRTAPPAHRPASPSSADGFPAIERHHIIIIIALPGSPPPPPLREPTITTLLLKTYIVPVTTSSFRVVRRRRGELPEAASRSCS